MNNNSSHSEHFEELCAAYVLCALDAGEREEFETMLETAGDEEQQTFLQFKAAANHLAFNTERAEPDRDVWENIRNEIQPSTGQQPAPYGNEKSERSGRSNYYMAVAAAVALLIASLALLFYVFSQHSTINHQQATITRLKGQVQKKEQLLSILSARTVNLVTMNGLDVNPNGYGKVIWDANKQQALLQVSNLPAVPEGKSYELWLIKGSKPLPSGVFAVKGKGQNAFFKISQMATASKQSAKSFAITLEPKGGSPTGKPTGEMYLLGNIKNSTN